MVSYLTIGGYADAASLNVKQLVTNGPSGRDFQNIMTFLFRRFDPTFHSTPMTHHGNLRSDEVILKFEDEVSMAFRCLGYPFPISKTGLVAVGSPHTWPALIAAIDWLVDLLTIRDDEESHDWGPDDNEEAVMTMTASLAQIESQFHKFLRRSMVAYLNDDNEECEELEGSLLDTFQKDSERVEVFLTGLDDECSRMKAEIESLHEDVNGLFEAQQKQEEYADNIERFLSLIQTLNDHKTELTTKVEALTIEKSTTEQVMKDCEKTIAALRDTIHGQELSQEDVRRMTRKKERIEEQINNQASVLEAQVATLKEAKEKWCTIFKLLEQKVDEYNARASQLELIPETARHAKGKRFEVKLDGDKAADGVASMLGVDMVGVMGPHVTKLVNNYESETANEKRRMAEVKDLIKAMEIEKDKLVKDIETIKQRITSSEKECNSMKEKLEADIQDKRRQLVLLNDRISSLNDPKGIESTIKKYEDEYEQLQLRQRKEEKENTAKLKAVHDEIVKALTLAKEYEVQKEKKLEEMNDYIRRQKEAIENVRLLDS